MALETNYLLINRYRIKETLGLGGMGAVYRAVDENLGVEVALKENFFSSEEYNRQFLREAKILATMRHPNLPRVSDHFEVPEQGQYLVMDYIHGEDLRQRLDRQGAISEEEAIIIGAAMCDALFYLHSRVPPILHRDIKPGNIKISADGSIYLVDFGLAKIVRGTEVTTTGARAMTPGYSSPEQYGTARTDARSDIYSLGATLYAALTATIPEDGLARAMDQADLTPLRKHNPRVSRKLASVIEKALEVHPDDRYQTGQDFRAALLESNMVTRNLKDKELTITPPPEEVIAALEANSSSKSSNPIRNVEITGQSRKRSRRKKWVSLRNNIVRITISSILLLVFIAGFGLMLRNGAFDFPSGILAYFAPVETPTSTATLTSLPTGTPEPDEVVEMANTTTTTPTVTPTITVTLTPKNTLTPLPASTDTPTIVPTWVITPVGGGTGQLAFVSDRSGTDQIWMMDITGDEVEFTQITDIPTGACQPEWSPEGTQLVFISPCKGGNQVMYDQSRLYLINADGTGLSILNTEQGSFDPAWSPDGQYILYTKEYDTLRSEIFRYNLYDQTSELMVGGGEKNIHPTWSPDGEYFVFISSRENSLRLFYKQNSPDAEESVFDRSINKENYYPDFSPDGNYLIFSQREGKDVVSRLTRLWVDVPRTPSEYYEEKVSKDGLIIPEVDPDYSPDGTLIAYESWPEGGNHDIYIINADGTNRSRITFDPSFDFDVAWRPKP
ncbi:MAG: protein kinase [Anaerolineales bacterium]|nr:protein kinase [Anaerolineales bacterium]